MAAGLTAASLARLNSGRLNSGYLNSGYVNESTGAARTTLGLPSFQPAERPAEPRCRIRPCIVEIKAGAHDHHFASTEVDGWPIAVLVESGASIVALTFDGARRAGVSDRGRDCTQRVPVAVLKEAPEGHVSHASARAFDVSSGEVPSRLPWQGRDKQCS